MAQFNVDSDTLALRSAAVRGSVERIRGEVEAMQHGLQELEGSWGGAAAATFQGLIVQWRGTQVQVEPELDLLMAV